MRVWMADSPAQAPTWLVVITMVCLLSHDICCVRISFNGFPTHETREICVRVVGTERAACPEFGMGMHLAYFHASGKVEWWKIHYRGS